MSLNQDRPEIGKRVSAAGIETNYLEAGSGPAVVLVHGSGPGVSAYANWRLTIPHLSSRFRVLAPDMTGFGFSERAGTYSLDRWVDQLVGLLDALELDQVSLVGNSFGGAIALRMAAQYSHRVNVNRLVLMGSVGISFPITPGLDAVWGYEPSVANMRALLEIFAFNQALVSDDLAEVRYRASIESGVQEAFSSMFPAPRQRWVDALATAEDDIKKISNKTLIVHGHDDQVIPLQNAYRLLDLIPTSDLVVFGQCGHWTQIERADQFNQLVLDFLTRPAA
jgi:2-hydroxy-6-oxo-octa-2,4-dienoate hydrolase